MGEEDAVVAVFADYAAAKAAIKKLTGDGFALKHLSLVAKGDRTMHLMTPAASLARESASA